MSDDGRLYVVAGASRSGKTAWTLKHIVGKKLILAWDIEDCEIVGKKTYAHLPGWQRVTSPKQLLELVKKGGFSKVAYCPKGDIFKEFEFWANCARQLGVLHGTCNVIMDELADVSQQGKASGKWGILIRRGMKRGISVYAISQRWAEADKTCVGNASEFICFRMSSGDDVSYMARKTRIAVTDLEGLKPLEYVRYDAGTGAKEQGKLRF